MIEFRFDGRGICADFSSPLDRPRALAAFQALFMMFKYDMRSCYGVNKTRALAVLGEIYAVKPLSAVAARKIWPKESLGKFDDWNQWWLREVCDLIVFSKATDLHAEG